MPVLNLGGCPTPRFIPLHPDLIPPPSDGYPTPIRSQFALYPSRSRLQPPAGRQNLTFALPGLLVASGQLLTNYQLSFKNLLIVSQLVWRSNDEIVQLPKE